MMLAHEVPPEVFDVDCGPFFDLGGNSNQTEGRKDHSAAEPQPKLEKHRGLRLKGICENTFN